MEKINILLIDDKPENLLALESVLESDEFNIYKAKSGSDGLALLLEHDFAIVLLDVQMPEMDGFETAELMRGMHKTRHIPIIFITAISKDEKYIFKGYESGAVDYIFKPFDAHILKSKVDVFRDLYQQKKLLEKQALELRNVNQELQDFAYIISHDLKAPLRAIRSLANWIKTDYEDCFDEEGREQMQLLIGRVKRMHDLIDGVLQYSRVGRSKEELVKVDLNTIVAEVIDLIMPPAHMSINIEHTLPTLYCEKTRIAQVFQNLLNNAVKYMDKPAGEIRIGVNDRENQWQFYVADNGPGIEEKNFARIFQIFQTLKPKDEGESTGIGLTLVKKIIEMYGGQIWIESTVGTGSTFYFTIPKNIKTIL